MEIESYLKSINSKYNLPSELFEKYKKNVSLKITECLDNGITVNQEVINGKNFHVFMLKFSPNIIRQIIKHELCGGSKRLDNNNWSWAIRRSKYIIYDHRYRPMKVLRHKFNKDNILVRVNWEYNSKYGVPITIEWFRKVITEYIFPEIATKLIKQILQETKEIKQKKTLVVNENNFPTPSFNTTSANTKSTDSINSYANIVNSVEKNMSKESNTGFKRHTKPHYNNRSQRNYQRGNNGERGERRGRGGYLGILNPNISYAEMCQYFRSSKPRKYKGPLSEIDYKYLWYQEVEFTPDSVQEGLDFLLKKGTNTNIDVLIYYMENN